jgi:acetyltransferase-like isoleucine patch superfamily enzyme
MKLLVWLLTELYEKILLSGNEKRKTVYLRNKGIKIGEDCYINTMKFSTEPYLIEIGNQVRIANGTKFITHDGSIHCFGDELNGEIFGRITIGNNVFIGTDCIIMLNTIIGDNCIVGAGSVVRGHFPENSVIIGNPAKIVLNVNIQKMLFRHNPGFLISKKRTLSEKEELVKKQLGIE